LLVVDNRRRDVDNFWSDVFSPATIVYCAHCLTPLADEKSQVKETAANTVMARSLLLSKFGMDGKKIELVREIGILFSSAGR